MKNKSFSKGLLVGLLVVVSASGAAFADNYYFRSKGITSGPPGVPPANAAISTPETRFRMGSSINGVLNTNLSNPSWVLQQTPASPSLDLSADGGSFTARAPSVSARTTFTISGEATEGKRHASTNPADITIYPMPSISGGPTAPIDVGTKQPIPTYSAYNLDGIIGTASYDLLSGGSVTDIGSVCPGLTFSKVDGTISGAGTNPCARQFSVRVTDTFDGASRTSDVVAITVSSLAMAGSDTLNAIVGTSASTQLSASGGSRSGYAFAVGSGSLPDGISLTPSGLLSVSSQIAAGTYPIVVRVTDSVGNEQTKTVAVIVTQPLALAGTVPSKAVIDMDYVGSLTASGGVTPYQWTATGLPDGIAVAAGGAISGKPTRAATFTPVIQVRDASGTVRTQTVSIKVNAALQISADVASLATAGFAYSSNPVVVGGEAPYTWTATGLPNGLALTSATIGTASGTPTLASTFTPVFKVTDAAGYSVSKTMNVTVNPALVLTGTIPNTASIGVDYSGSMTATGGGTPRTWSATGLPAGLSINTSSGAITGKPTASGNFAPVIRVTDNAGAFKTATGSIQIVAPITFTRTPAAVSAESGANYSDSSVVVNGGSGSYSKVELLNQSDLGYTASISGGTITISGNKNIGTQLSKAYTGLQLRVTDSTGATGTGNAFTITVSTASSTQANRAPVCFYGQGSPGSGGYGGTCVSSGAPNVPYRQGIEYRYDKPIRVASQMGCFGGGSGVKGAGYQHYYYNGSNWIAMGNSSAGLTVSVTGGAIVAQRFALFFASSGIASETFSCNGLTAY
jgi:hypothetical protein